MSEKNAAWPRNFGPRSGINKGMSTEALPSPDPALLPDDPGLLKQLVLQLLEELRSAQARLERQEHHMHLLLKRLYGSPAIAGVSATRRLWPFKRNGTSTG